MQSGSTPGTGSSSGIASSRGATPTTDAPGSWTAREPFVTWLDEIHRDVGPTMHRITNHQIRVDDGTATATSYFDALLQVEHREHDLLHVVGTYDDELVRIDDGWRITSRRSDNFLWRRGSRNTA